MEQKFNSQLTKAVCTMPNIVRKKQKVQKRRDAHVVSLGLALMRLPIWVMVVNHVHPDTRAHKRACTNENIVSNVSRVT